MAAEDVAENWEDLEDSGELDRRLQSVQVEKQDKASSKCDGDAGEAREPVILREDSDRTPYQPTFKILKREPNPSHDSSAMKSQQAKPLKTLAEREAAYAEARLRILGAPSGEEDLTAETDDRPARIVQQLENVNLSGNVVRQPLGPDGSKGFSTNQDLR